MARKKVGSGNATAGRPAVAEHGYKFKCGTCTHVFFTADPRVEEVDSSPPTWKCPCCHRPHSAVQGAPATGEEAVEAARAAKNFPSGKEGRMLPPDSGAPYGSRIARVESARELTVCWPESKYARKGDYSSFSTGPFFLKVPVPPGGSVAEVGAAAMEELRELAEKQFRARLNEHRRHLREAFGGGDE